MEPFWPAFWPGLTWPHKNWASLGLRRDGTELGNGIGSGIEWCACFGFGINTVCHSTSPISRTHRPTSPFQVSHPLSWRLQIWQIEKSPWTRLMTGSKAWRSVQTPKKWKLPREGRTGSNPSDRPVWIGKWARAKAWRLIKMDNLGELLFGFVWILRFWISYVR